MKKVLCTLLTALLCCGMFVGCGDEEKTLTDDFIEDENQKENLAGYSFEVPGAWEKGGNSTEDILYFYPAQGMLMVMYSEIEASISNDSNREDFIEGMSSAFEQFEMIEESEATVNGEDAYKFQINAELAGDDYEITMVSFDAGSGILSFMMGILQTSDEDYSTDFDKVIQSVQKPLPFARTIDDVRFVFSLLQESDEYNFLSDGVQEMSDGSTMQILHESVNGAIITILGDENENLTLVSVSADEEEYFSSMCAMALIGSGIQDGLPLDLSSDGLKEMGTEPTDAIIEVSNGISYLLQKSDDGSYTMIVQRDLETKEDYEAFVKES